MSIIRLSDQYTTSGAFDPTVMLERIGGNLCLFAELVGIFLEEYPPLLDQIRLAIADNDANKLKQPAHSLRGAIGNFTVARPYELAKQLESMAQTNNLKDTRALLDSLTEGVDQLAIALKKRVSCSDS